MTSSIGKIIKLVNYYDNTVYLNVNKFIKNEDIELVNLFFQTNSYSGGDDTIETKYDKQKNLLEINFLKNFTKQEILRRREFSYKTYNFQAYEQKMFNHHSNFVKLKKTLVFENFRKNEDFNDIELYVNYLVRNNVVSKIESSNILDNFIYIKFKESNMDFTEIHSYLAKRPTFKDNMIRVYEAYETNTVLMKIIDSKISVFVDYLNKNFMVKDQCYWQVPFSYDDSPFIIIKFKNTETKQRFVSGFKASDIKDVYIEPLYNVDNLNDYLNEFWFNLNNKKFCYRNGPNIVEFDTPETSSSLSESSSQDDTNPNCVNKNFVVESNPLAMTIQSIANANFVSNKHLQGIEMFIQNTCPQVLNFNQNVKRTNQALNKKTPNYISNILQNMKLNDESTSSILNNNNNKIGLIQHPQFKVIKKRNRKKNYPKKCDLCPYIAFQSICLDLHMKGHLNKNGYFKCRFCNFNSELQLALQNHEKLHLNEKK